MTTDEQPVPPILFLCATARDSNRKGCTTKAGDVGGTGLWDCCEKLWSSNTSAAKGSGTADGGSSIDKRSSFYVGNAAGRAGDHSDCDLYLVRSMLYCIHSVFSGMSELQTYCDIFTSIPRLHLYFCSFRRLGELEFPFLQKVTSLHTRQSGMLKIQLQGKPQQYRVAVMQKIVLKLCPIKSHQRLWVTLIFPWQNGNPRVKHLGPFVGCAGALQTRSTPSSRYRIYSGCAVTERRLNMKATHC